jgi:hypothetical protein
MQAVLRSSVIVVRPQHPAAPIWDPRRRRTVHRHTQSLRLLASAVKRVRAYGRDRCLHLWLLNRLCEMLGLDAQL